MRCSFCKNNIEQGTGKIFIKKEGKILYFCSRRCEKVMLKLKRKSRETKWTAEYRNLKQETKK